LFLGSEQSSRWDRRREHGIDACGLDRARARCGWAVADGLFDGGGRLSRWLHGGWKFSSRAAAFNCLRWLVICRNWHKLGTGCC
jgi:hypothetical protein